VVDFPWLPLWEIKKPVRDLNRLRGRECRFSNKTIRVVKVDDLTKVIIVRVIATFLIIGKGLIPMAKISGNRIIKTETGIIKRT
jgi:hypothetical protein